MFLNRNASGDDECLTSAHSAGKWCPWQRKKKEPLGSRQPFLKGSPKNRHTHTHSGSPLSVCGHCLISIHCLFGCLNAQASVTELSQPQCVCVPPLSLFPSFCLGLERDGSCVFFISLFGVDLGSVCASLSHRAPIWFVNSFVVFFFPLWVYTHVTSINWKVEKGWKQSKGYFFLSLLSVVANLRTDMTQNITLR